MGDENAFRFAPVTPATQADLERFSQADGKFRYCSCLRWRLRSAEFRDAADRPGQLAGLVADSRPVGVLAYRDGEPVGWCSVAPRESYAAVTTATTIPSLPGADVWAVTCFLLAPGARRAGLQPRLLTAACDCADAGGADHRGVPVAGWCLLPLHGHPRALPGRRVHRCSRPGRRPARDAVPRTALTRPLRTRRLSRRGSYRRGGQGATGQFRRRPRSAP